MWWKWWWGGGWGGAVATGVLSCNRCWISQLKSHFFCFVVPNGNVPHNTSTLHPHVFSTGVIPQGNNAFFTKDVSCGRGKSRNCVGNTDTHFSACKKEKQTTYNLILRHLKTVHAKLQKNIFFGKLALALTHNVTRFTQKSARIKWTKFGRRYW